MNKEDYVSLEVAKLLKEKEYDEECGLAISINSREGQRFISHRTNSLLPRDICSKPNLYEAQKWLRNKHKIHICVDFNASGWYCRLYEIIYGEFILQTEGYKDSYEEALNAGILGALRLI